MIRLFLLIALMSWSAVAQTSPPSSCTSGTTDCRTDPCTCKNGGNCVAPDYTTCACMTQFTGYAGDYCTIPQCDDMSRFPYGCRAGVCVAPNTCDCNGTGFTGIDCNIPVCETTCKHGRCVGPNTCDCSGTGFAGTLCEIPQCEPPCLNGGTCVGPDTCDCSTSPPRASGLAGFNGTHCEFAICQPGCKNQGKCSGPNQCACEGTGFAGPLCDYDENECLRLVSPCDNRTTCTNKIGGFECSPCPAGLYGSPYLSRGGCQNTPVTLTETGPTKSTGVGTIPTTDVPTNIPTRVSSSGTPKTTDKSNGPTTSTGKQAESNGTSFLSFSSLLVGLLFVLTQFM